MDKYSTVTQKLQDLGFTAYEAKAYIALLENNPVTRYELSKNSGIPRSAIYNVIVNLEKLGAVNAQSLKPEKYIPLQPAQLFELLKRKYENKIDLATEDLKDLETRENSDHLWNIVGYDNMMLKAREMIQKATGTLYLSIWQKEYNLLKHDLVAAIRRGVEIIVYSFTAIDLHGAKVFSYGLAEDDLEKIWGHKLILIRDKKELIMGEADRSRNRKTVWTSNQALIDIATDHIILDITILGMRLHTHVDATIATMKNGETENLEKLLQEKYPEMAY